MHAIVACKKVHFSKMVKKNYLYFVCFWIFRSFSVVFALLEPYIPFSENNESLPQFLGIRTLVSYYLHMLYILVIYVYVYK